MTESSPVTVEQPASPTVEAYVHLVVVPRTTGPLVDVDAPRGRSADELDATIDEVFGETTDERPGRLDAVLVAGGLGVSVWALVTAAQGPFLLIGIVAVLLGIALPARSLARATRRRRQMGRRRRAIGDGFPLDASHRATHELVVAYDACLRAAAAPGVPHGADAADAAHLAMVEVASLLAGGGPLASAEARYVRKRTQAIKDVTAQLEAAQRTSVGSRPGPSIPATPAERERATAVTQAREELEATTGLGSVDRLAEVGASLEREADDGDR